MIHHDRSLARSSSGTTQAIPLVRRKTGPADDRICQIGDQGSGHIDEFVREAIALAERVNRRLAERAAPQPIVVADGPAPEVGGIAV